MYSQCKVSVWILLETKLATLMFDVSGNFMQFINLVVIFSRYLLFFPLHNQFLVFTHICFTDSPVPLSILDVFEVTPFDLEILNTTPLNNWFEPFWPKMVVVCELWCLRYCNFSGRNCVLGYPSLLHVILIVEWV